MSGNDSELEPLVQPRLIRLLKNRPRLVDFGVREELLEELEQQVILRRTPDNVAESMISQIIRGTTQRASEVTEPVFKNRTAEKMSKINETRLKNL